MHVISNFITSKSVTTSNLAYVILSFFFLGLTAATRLRADR